MYNLRGYKSKIIINTFLGNHLVARNLRILAGLRAIRTKVNKVLLYYIKWINYCFYLNLKKITLLISQIDNSKLFIK